VFIARKRGMAISTHAALVYGVALTSAVWIIVTFLTRPTNRETLVRFYRLVRPFGRGWAAIRREAGVGPSPDSLPHCLLGWVLGCALVYSALFGVGCFLYGKTPQGVVCLVVFLASAGGLAWLLPRLLGEKETRGAPG
jgi:hypothetical protein